MAETPLLQYFKLVDIHDRKIIFVYPLILTAVIITFTCKGDIESILSYLLDFTPTLSSIILGFLGMIAIATISSSHVFDKMKRIQYQNTEHSMFNIFIRGIYVNILFEIILLFESIFMGLIKSGFCLDFNIKLIFTALLIFTLMCSTSLFVNNMNRIYYSTTFYNQ